MAQAFLRILVRVLFLLLVVLPYVSSLERMHMSASHHDMHICVYAPVNGCARKLSELSDPVFSQEMLGAGVAVEYESGDVFAPISGTLTSLYMPSCHAFVITSPEGVEVLVHVGIDTVKLPAGVLQPLCATGEQVSQGDCIVQVDEEKLRASAHDLSTAIIVLQEDKPCRLQMCARAGDSCQARETQLFSCEYDDPEIGEASKSAVSVAPAVPTTPAPAPAAPTPAPAAPVPSSSPIPASVRYMSSFLGGALGTLARYGVCVACGLGCYDPIVILAINSVGSFILGYAQICIDDSHPRLKQAVTNGFCGAFTSYASFVAILIFLSMSPPHALFYASLCLVGGTCCALGGRFCGRVRIQAKRAPLAAGSSIRD